MHAIRITLNLAILAALFTPAPAQSVAGAARSGPYLFTWGRDIRRWDLKRLTSMTLVVGGPGRTEGGCIALGGLLLQEGPDLVLRRPPRYLPEIVDRDVEIHDCRHTSAGVLVIHRYTQLRLYTPPSKSGIPWPNRELYSIYTASRQGGLIASPEAVFAGNYWFVPGPAWREFAVNTWSETTDSALLSLAFAGRNLLAAQGHLPLGRVALFSPPADRTQLWNELRLAEELQLRFPHAVAADEDRIVVGENAGRGSRLFLFRNNRPPVLLGVTDGAVAAFIEGNRVVTAGAGGVKAWLLPPDD